MKHRKIRSLQQSQAGDRSVRRRWRRMEEEDGGEEQV